MKNKLSSLLPDHVTGKPAELRNETSAAQVIQTWTAHHPQRQADKKTVRPSDSWKHNRTACAGIALALSTYCSSASENLDALIDKAVAWENSMIQIVNQVVRLHLPWAPHVKIICVHRREVGGYADACWIQFACENPSDPAVVGAMAQDPHLRSVVEAYNSKRLSVPKKNADVTDE